MNDYVKNCTPGPLAVGDVVQLARCGAVRYTPKHGGALVACMSDAAPGEMVRIQAYGMLELRYKRTYSTGEATYAIRGFDG